MLEALGPGLWIVEGPVVTAAAGFHYPTRMAVILLANSDLVLWSPVAPTAELQAAIGALGRVGHLVAPNSLHHVFIGDWQALYPDAQVHAAPGLRDKRRDIRFDADLGDVPTAAWEGEIDQAVMRGNRITTEVVFFHRQSGTVIFTDLLQSFPPGWFAGWRALVARLDLMLGDVPRVPRKFRVAFTDRVAARQSLRRILAWPARNVLMAHGTPVRGDGQAFLQKAFRWLGP